ncbi:hypothetical protein KHS38_12680 [Mucilaginibacter sp. Bleaf8]|uniref:hypothetical protein n=1 Tax=Mucilaginibacter sp. Bleaf8 TaxID=2834430 RepID=UPI001BD1BCB5|nr:hypothetical protein [Mucilaginibacter sp. Bleaf8]MBS7565261.1 hypothetical protein [Mucilaginibacter sp. Bleaf8]
MKKRSKNILSSIWLLLIFVTGQVIVFAHNHQSETSYIHYTINKHKSNAVDTKCQICAQSSHVQMMLQTQQLFFFTASITHQYVTYTEIYQSIELLLSGNRGPPAEHLFA